MTEDVVQRARALLVKLNPKFGVRSLFREESVGRYRDGDGETYIEINPEALAALLAEVERQCAEIARLQRFEPCWDPDPFRG